MSLHKKHIQSSSASAGQPLSRVQSPQTLLIDADDTLWENNIYFEQAISSFISYVNHRTYTPQEVRLHLNRHEMATIRAHGYGLKSFRMSLVRCFEELASKPVTPEMHHEILSFTDAIAADEMELISGVAETLHQLSARHTVWLVTKGNDAEQRNKLQRSQLAHLFHGVEVLPEKNELAYRTLITRRGWDAANTWMIGNSPKSDINPSLAAGLHAIFIPHAHTWIMEEAELSTPPDGKQLIELSNFTQLADIF
ncbi:MAG TPA: HAD hydrolase-like protein [Acidobacteriaceae bacterium]